jgi:uncharacterized cupin superfamily protein
VIVHWDEVVPRRVELGHLRSGWRDVGRAAGSVGVRLRRITVDPGAFSTPVHVHKHEEELFFVLAGSGLSWQDGETYEVGAGDLLVHLEGAEAHTLRAGDAGLDVLAFGAPQERASGAYLPRAGVIWSFPHWLEADPGRAPFEREADLGPPECPVPAERPARIANVADASVVSEWTRPGHRNVALDLGRSAGSGRTGLKHVTLEPGQMGPPPHCHSAEEELFVVLEGGGTLLLGEEEHPVRAGHVVARPPGTRIAHALVAGAGGLTYLAYGTREPNDIAYYPRSNKVYLRGIGVIGRIERLEYWDDEP